MASPGFHDAQALIFRVKSLINAQLKSVLKKAGLPVSGVKAALQDRIIAQIEAYVHNRNIEGYIYIRSAINNPDGSLPSSPATSHSFRAAALMPSHQPQTSHPTQPSPLSLPARPSRPSLPSPLSHLSQPHNTSRVNFKESPFYSVLEPLTPLLECKAREHTRDQVDFKIIFRADTVDLFSSDTTMKAMIYCAAEPISPFTKVDISFPHQVEIKVNLDEVKANLRGLKNKPGSTRPADITQWLRKRAGYENSIVVTYALTVKKFYMIVNLVKQNSAESLVTKLKSGKTFSRERVVREMITKSEDSDLVATSTVMSLKCPLSTLRMNLPIRSTVCSHNQCFDALSFLQLQEQAPTWTCPHCNKVVCFEALVVDEYINDILQNTPTSVDQVIIEPNGDYHTTDTNASLKRSREQESGGEDDDLLEIRNMPRIAAVKSEIGLDSRTPPGSSREHSVMTTSSSAKRPIGQVIDLTFSSDEDEPPRPPKRKANLAQPTSLSRYPSTETLPTRLNGTVLPQRVQSRPSIASSYDP